MTAIKYLYQKRIILVHVDKTECNQPLQEVTALAFRLKWTTICAWSKLEVARYLETFKVFEKKSSEMIQEKVDQDQKSLFTNCLSTIRSINKTDIATLATSFNS